MHCFSRCDLCLVPSTHVRWSITTCNSTSIGSDIFILQISTYCHIIKTKYFFEEKDEFLRAKNGSFFKCHSLISYSILYCFTYKSTKIIQLIAHYLAFSFLSFFCCQQNVWEFENEIHINMNEKFLPVAQYFAIMINE